MDQRVACTYVCFGDGSLDNRSLEEDVIVNEAKVLVKLCHSPRENAIRLVGSLTALTLKQCIILCSSRIHQCMLCF